MSKRRPQDDLKCNFGPVLDLSATGMRLVASKKLSGIVKVTLHGIGIDQTLRARVVRSTKISFRVYEVALEFLDHSELKQVVGWISRWSARRLAG